MRILIGVLVLLLLVLQYRLWVSDDGMPEVWRLERARNQQREQNRTLEERNRALEAEVRDLKEGIDAVEERARTELGMIQEGETFYQVVPEGEDVPDHGARDAAPDGSAGEDP